MTRTHQGKPGLLFDLDGTLTNADHFHHAAFNVLLAQSGRQIDQAQFHAQVMGCLLYTSPSPRDGLLSRMPSSA